jgi:hypothetical protein
MPIFDHELGAKKISPLFVGFVSGALNLDTKTYLYNKNHNPVIQISVTWLGFIITVPHKTRRDLLLGYIDAS